MSNKYKDLQIGDLLIRRKDSSLHIILEINKQVGKGYGRKKFDNHRYSYLLISHNGDQRWWKDVDLRVKFRIPSE